MSASYGFLWLSCFYVMVCVCCVRAFLIIVLYLYDVNLVLLYCDVCVLILLALCNSSVCYRCLPLSCYVIVMMAFKTSLLGVCHFMFYVALCLLFIVLSYFYVLHQFIIDCYR